jgi:hypothetical protein
MLADAASSYGNTVKDDIDDCIIPIESLKQSPSASTLDLPSPGEVSNENAPEVPSDVVTDDLASPDGGYGWVVVMYFPQESCLIIELFVS